MRLYFWHSTGVYLWRRLQCLTRMQGAASNSYRDFSDLCFFFPFFQRWHSDSHEFGFLLAPQQHHPHRCLSPPSMFLSCPPLLDWDKSVDRRGVQDRLIEQMRCYTSPIQQTPQVLWWWVNLIIRCSSDYRGGGFKYIFTTGTAYAACSHPCCMFQNVAWNCCFETLILQAQCFFSWVCASSGMNDSICQLDVKCYLSSAHRLFPVKS